MLVAAVLCGRATAQSTNYIVGAQDILTITVWNEPELSGKYTVEADGTFSYPLVGRVRAGGITLRSLEDDLRKRLSDGYLRKPQVSVSVDAYRSQRVFVIGEVRNPGAYPLTGDMRLMEALARAGSTTANAGGEVLIIHEAADRTESGPHLPAAAGSADTLRVDMRGMQNGTLPDNPGLQDGDTVFVAPAESVYVFGEVRTPGAFVIRRDTTVLQALSLAGGVTDRGTTSRVRIVRIVNGNRTELKANLSDRVQPGDTVIVLERFF